jgi:hypothetical protein
VVHRDLVDGRGQRGAIVGLVAEHEAATGNNQATSFQQGYSIGHDAGARFGHNMAALFWLERWHWLFPERFSVSCRDTRRGKKESGDQ